MILRRSRREVGGEDGPIGAGGQGYVRQRAELLPAPQFNNCERGAPSGGSQVREPDQSAGFLVVEAQAQRPQALGQRQLVHLLEHGLLAEALREPVIGDRRAQVMDMVKADVAGEPVQNSRQRIHRAALQRDRHVIASIAALPVDPVELVLDVEQPDTGGARDGEGGDQQQKRGGDSEGDEECAESGDQREVGEVNASSAGRPRHRVRQPLLEKDDKQRADTHHHDRVSVEPVAEPHGKRRLAVLADGQGPDVAETAAVEIAGRRVVSGMFDPPVVVGREGHNSGQIPDELVRRLGLEERAVTAVVEEDEDPDQKTGGEHLDREREPIRDGHQPIREDQQQQVASDAVDQLPQRSPQIGSLVHGDCLPPGFSHLVEHRNARFGRGHVNTRLVRIGRLCRHDISC